ncbi:MAG: hypothetical protein IJZ82_01785 [Lachnospiraceae bacterium]|nr:hypothetical protein [Lachnospiraceae bacterium]
MAKNKSVYIVTLIIGIMLLICSFFVRGEELKTVSGVMIGVGSAILGTSIAKLWMKNFEEKNPDIMKDNEIEFKDERNTLIRYRAKAQAGDIIQWFIIGIAYLLIIIDAPLWVILVTVGIFLLYNILGVYFMSRYQKEM